MTMKCTSTDTEQLAFWQQHSKWFPMLSKFVALFKQCSQQLVSF